MSATRLWSPVTRPAPFWLKPLPRNACSPVADGAALGTCVRLPTAATAAGRWLPSRGRCPHRSRPRQPRLVRGSIARFGMGCSRPMPCALEGCSLDVRGTSRCRARPRAPAVGVGVSISTLTSTAGVRRTWHSPHRSEHGRASCAPHRAARAYPGTWRLPCNRIYKRTLGRICPIQASRQPA